MSVGSAVRESLTQLATRQIEIFVCCVAVVGAFAMVSAIVVLFQYRMAKGIHRIQSRRVMAKLVGEGCLVVDCLVDIKPREMLRHLGYAVVYFFEWKSLTFIGRLDSQVVTIVGGLGIALLGADFLEAVVKIAELLLRD